MPEVVVDDMLVYVSGHCSSSSSYGLPLQLTGDRGFFHRKLVTGFLEFQPPRLQPHLSDVERGVGLYAVRCQAPGCVRRRVCLAIVGGVVTSITAL